MPTDYGFTGQHSDAATGLDDYGARYYDPLAGQFISADTMLPGNGMDPWGLSRYAYVEGNPLIRVDPTGHDGGWLGGLASAVTSTVSSVVSTVAPVVQAAGPVAWAALDATTGIPSMINDVQTIFSGNASTLDKIMAGADILVNVAMDVSMVVGVGEGARALYVGAKVATHVAVDVGEHALVHEGEDAVTHVVTHDAADLADKVATSCAMSFAASTLVLTPLGARAIASLKAGDKVTTYDPQSGKPNSQTVEATSIHHDANLVDVTLQVTAAGAKTAVFADKTSAKSSTTTTTAPKTHTEVVYTTANHPWLSADHGWLIASFLRVGESVQQADGSVATVERVQSVPGDADMWDLTVSQVHDFAVGNSGFVVHNCGGTLTDGTAVDFSKDSKGFQHSVNKHAIPEWLGRDAATGTISDAEKDTWHAAIQDTAENSKQIFPWSTSGRQTTGVLGRLEGRPFLVQFDRSTGDLATAFFPNREQLYAIRGLL